MKTMNDNETKIETLREIASECGGTLETDYSGRSMYGAQCVGIICDDPQWVMEEAASRGIRGAHEDNMGKQYIVYWPRIETKPSQP